MTLGILDTLKKTPEERTGIRNPSEFERESATFDRLESTLRGHAERVLAKRQSDSAASKSRG